MPAWNSVERTEVVDFAQLDAARTLMLRAVIYRGFPAQDAEDVVQDVVAQILSRQDGFAWRLAALDDHKGYFVTMALNAYLMRMRSEKRRRLREERHGHVGVEAGAPGSGQGAEALMELVDAAPLTELQRRYVTHVFEDHLEIEDIAEKTGTSSRAVRAVLQRATESLRRHRNASL